ncbi:MAG: IS1634 family transposase [Acetobacteraceae bacterium]
MTLSAQIDKIRQRFNLRRVVMVGDRSMLTDARIEQTLRPAGLDWITALCGVRPSRCWRQRVDRCSPRCSMIATPAFARASMAEITSPDYPGERLVVCKNPLLAEQRTRKRDELLAATEMNLARIQHRVQRAANPLRGAAEIGKAVGSVLGKCKMAKHFDTSITDDSFSFTRDNAAIAAEAALDGIYVVRTNLPAAQSDAATTVRAYKSLAGVEHAFRSMKTVDLELRPVFHWTAPRVRAHVLLCMLAYYLEWHMRQRLAPILFDEHDPLGRDAQHSSPVAKATPSPAARDNAAGKRTDPAHGGPLPVHSFHTLLADLATLTRNAVLFGKTRRHILLAEPTKPNAALSICSASQSPRRQVTATKFKLYQALASKAR